MFGESENRFVFILILRAVETPPPGIADWRRGDRLPKRTCALISEMEKDFSAARVFCLVSLSLSLFLEVVFFII